MFQPGAFLGQHHFHFVRPALACFEPVAFASHLFPDGALRPGEFVESLSPFAFHGSQAVQRLVMRIQSVGEAGDFVEGVFFIFFLQFHARAGFGDFGVGRLVFQFQVLQARPPAFQLGEHPAVFDLAAGERV